MKLKKRIPEPTELVSDSSPSKKYLILDSKNYKNKNSSYRLVSKDLMKRISIESGEVLDVGCGYGGFMGVLNEYLPNISYTGIDASKWIIKFAKNIHKKSKNIKLINSRAEKMPFEDGSFDVLICRDVIHHLNNPLKVLKEMIRVTRRGGLIYIVDLRRDISEDLIYDGLWEFFHEYPTIAIDYLYSIRASYTISEIKKLFKKAGLKKFSIETFNKKSNKYLNIRWIATINK